MNAAASLYSAEDHARMAEALRLARRGLHTCEPNPRVGCVIARDGEIVGRGWHRRAGEPHAEPLALAEAGGRARGATAWVTLEPCSFRGRTPPCTDALVEAGVARVVVAMIDPHPRVAGRGVEALREAGIDVQVGLMHRQAAALNPGFVSRFERGRPWVRAKVAASIDGRTRGPDGESKWITSAAARADGHRWRARSSAILTGIGTVLDDDPRLDVRGIDDVRAPLVVVADSRGRMPAGARLLQGGSPVLVAGLACREDLGGAESIAIPAGSDGRVDLERLLSALAEREVNELHVEAGPTLTGALLAAGLVDELLVYQAACVVGERGGALAAIPALEKFDDRLHLQVLEQRRVGPDLRVRLVPRRADALPA